MQVFFKKLRADAIAPKQATDHAAGFDMCAPERVEIAAGQTYWVKSGISMAIPAGWVGLVWPRSGLAYKHGIDTLGGVIDADYRGEVQIGLINHGSQPIEIAAGDRVCQLIIQPYLAVSQVVDELPEIESNRTGGFGSTGLKPLNDHQVARQFLAEKINVGIPTSQEEVQQRWADRSGQ